MVLKLWLGAFVLQFLAAGSHASPLSSSSDSEVKRDIDSPQLLPRVVTKQSFRILPIGDSITVGQGSTDHNGYRLNLRNILTYLDNQVDFIGSGTSGDNNPDNQEEGISGARIWGIRDAVNSDGILGQRPNLVIIHAGTNDMIVETDTEKYVDAPSRLGDLIDAVVNKCPDAVVLVAILIQNKYHPDQNNAYNAKIPGVVAQRAAKGHKVVTVDQTGIKDNLLSDLLHPNDQGYRIMAENWWKAIEKLPAGWLTPPK